MNHLAPIHPQKTSRIPAHPLGRRPSHPLARRASHKLARSVGGRLLLKATCLAFLANLLLPNALPFVAAARADVPAAASQLAPHRQLALSETAATNDPADVAAPGAKAVTNADEIRAKLDNVTIYGRYVDNGDEWVEYHLADGRTAYWEKGCTYPGKWWIADDGEVCYAYPNYRDNAPNCFIMFVRPDGGVQFVSISDTGQAYLASDSEKIMPGNDAHLPVGGVSPCVGA